MFLKIILVIVFVKLLTDYLWIKEGFPSVLDQPPLNTIKMADSDNASSASCNINIIFPNPVYYKNDKGEQVLSHYDTKNNYINNDWKNINKAANPDDC
jgi:hypothetical protein